MAKYMLLEIDNSAKSAVKTGKWKAPGAAFYDQLLNSYHYGSNKIPEDAEELNKLIQSGKYKSWPQYLEEAYLVAPVRNIHNSPHGVTPFSRSGCKYPHHVIRDGKLVVSVPGVKATYARALQMGVLKGDVKKHLERHIKELGLEVSFKSGALSWNEAVDRQMDGNFDFIYKVIQEHTGIDLSESDPAAFMESVITGNETPAELEEKAEEILEWITEAATSDGNTPKLSELIEDLKTPKDLLNWMDCIQYGWLDQEGNVNGTGEDDSTDYMFSQYRLQSPRQLLKSKVGVCWDQCELEREWFQKHNYPFVIVYIEIDDDEAKPTHTFLVYKEPGESKEVYWFEHSWGQKKGIHKFTDFKTCVQTIIQQHEIANGKKHGQNPVYAHIMKKPKPGLDVIKFMSFARSGFKIDLGDIQYDEIFNEVTSVYDEKKDVLSDILRLPDECGPYTLATLPQYMYHGSNQSFRTLSGKNLFLTPHPGIASCFLIPKQEIIADAFRKKFGKDPVRVSFNAGYDAWKYEDQDLRKPLKLVKITHNIPTMADTITGTKVGYIHVVDIKTIRDKLRTNPSTNDPDREVIYNGDDVPSEKILPVKIKYELRYDPENERLHGKGIVEAAITEADEPPTMDDPNPEKPAEEPAKESKPKKVDRAESPKNGVRRKKLYIAFIEWCKEYNDKNTFGSIFDEDAFKVSYPFVPGEMRYFYRLANPMLCVLGGELTFFPASELRKLNAQNSNISQQLIFAATPNDLRVFNCKDKKVYRGTIEAGALTLHETLGETFDTYIQTMIKKGDILTAPLEDE